MILFYLLVGLGILVLLLWLVAPRRYHVYRSTEIEKPRASVFGYVKFLKNQSAWSPWEERDPHIKKEFRGSDGEVGAISYWKGTKDAGEGEQEIIRIMENEALETQLRFFKPWKSVSDAYIRVEDAGPNTLVTWGFEGENRFPAGIFMLFMNMDKMLGKDFEAGLAKLKTVLERSEEQQGMEEV